MVVGADSGARRILFADNNYMGFDTAGSERMRINSSGQVGIGVAPTHAFNLQGTGSVEARFRSTDGDMSLQISSDADEGQDSTLSFLAGTGDKGKIVYNHHTTAASQKMNFITGDNAVTAMTITGDGKIGVQLTDPATILHIENCPDNKIITMAQSGRANHIGNYYSTGSTDSHMNFHVSSGNTNGSSTQRMKLYADGRCQIGYDDHDPIRTLEVVEQAGEAVLRIASINDTYGDDIRLEFASGSNGPSGGGFVQSSIHLEATSTSSSQVLNFRLVDNSSIKLWLNGSGFNGTHASTSDIALKENIADLSDGTTLIKALRPRTFDWKEDMEHAGLGTGQTGFIAQEVEAVSDKLISGEDGTKGIYTMGLLSLAIKTIQELEARITALEE